MAGYYCVYSLEYFTILPHREPVLPLIDVFLDWELGQVWEKGERV
jgi:hypothetical protein